MKSSVEILTAIRSHMDALYTCPEDSVRDLGELDCLLYSLHWLYFDATGKLEQFADARWQRFMNSPELFSRIQSQKESDAVIHSADDARDIIEYWMSLGKELGL